MNPDEVKKAWDELLYHLNNYIEVLVYQKPKGNWVKNFIISKDEKDIACKTAIGEVFCFKNREDALSFWAKKTGCENSEDVKDVNNIFYYDKL